MYTRFEYMYMYIQSIHVCIRDRPPEIEDWSADDSDKADDNKEAEAAAAKQRQEQELRLKQERDEQARYSLLLYTFMTSWLYSQNVFTKF